MRQLWIVAMVACGGAKVATTPVTNEGHVGPWVEPMQLGPYALAAPRPDVDVSALVADPTERARWPLPAGTHPALEPHFNVAAALAQPGIGWLELCRRGAQHRHLSRDQDVTEYLHAWCSVADRDTSDALYRLGQLHDSSIHGLADAVRHDCADILADHGDASDVEGLLMRAHLLDVGIVDLLAASYFEVGRWDDAFATNELARGMDRRPTEEMKCRRIVRGVIVGHDFQQLSLMAELHDIVEPRDPNKQQTSDSTCIALDAEVRCWHDPARGCDAFIKDPRQRALVRAYFVWPDDVGSFNQWNNVVALALAAIPLDDGYRLAIPALRMAARTSRCEPLALRELADHARDLTKYAPASVTTELQDLQARLRTMALSVHDCRDALEAMASP